LTKPLFAIVGLLLVEGHVDQPTILGLDDVKRKAMLVNGAEVLDGVLGITGTQTLVVLGFPTTTVVILGLPFLVLRHSIEDVLLLALPNLDDGGDELDQKVRNSEQGGVEVVQEVDKETLDMRPIMILYWSALNTFFTLPGQS
jgi:hypothetical protein